LRRGKAQEVSPQFVHLGFKLLVFLLVLVFCTSTQTTNPTKITAKTAAATKSTFIASRNSTGNGKTTVPARTVKV
jgi:hypothetical protein